MKFTWPRRLSMKDRHDVIRLMNAVAVRETTLGFHEELSMDAGLALMEDFDEDLRRGRVEFLAVRTDDDTIVGMVTLAQAALPARRHIVEMRRCVVDPSYRGSFLLRGWEHAVARVREIGGEIITLEVRADGPEELWRRLGFQSYGLLPDYARVRGNSIVGHYMYAVRAEIEDHFRTTGSWVHDIGVPVSAAR